MIEVRETLSHECPDARVVINAKDVHGAFLFEWGQRAPTGSVDLNAAGVVLRHVRCERFVHVKSGFVDL
jgi:hypothetical protein